MMPVRVSLALAAALALAMALPVSPGFAAGSIVDSPPKESDFEKAVKAVKQQKYKDAVEQLEKVVKKEPSNADAWNYLGYSQRKTGKFDVAMKSYTRALELNPNHKGAHE